MVLIEGRWSTGAGLSSQQTVALLRRQGFAPMVEPLSDSRYWGRPSLMIVTSSLHRGKPDKTTSYGIRDVSSNRRLERRERSSMVAPHSESLASRVREHKGGWGRTVVAQESFLDEFQAFCALNSVAEELLVLGEQHGASIPVEDA